MFYSDFAAAQRGERDYRSTTRDVRRLLQELKQSKVDGIVLDLRQNGGGSLQEAVELTGLFIPQGPVVQVRNSGGGVEVENDPDPSLVYDGPLAVLVDHYSASASEIFAGAIQDYGRGIVIGDPTFGKGTVQTLIDLGRFLPTIKEPVGQLKLTVAKFYRINGSSTQNRGVIPDIALPSAFDPNEVGESAQEFALPWDEIKPVPYAGSHRLAGLLPELEQRHQARTAASPAFTALEQEIETSKEAREKTTVSLLKRKREAEWAKIQAKQRELENQRRAALGLPPLRADETPPDQDEITTSADNTKQPDLLLDESARILVDLIDLLDTHGGQKALVMNIGNPAAASEH
jgi:carboxyl-terminal processing protease